MRYFKRRRQHTLRVSTLIQLYWSLKCNYITGLVQNRLPIFPRNGLSFSVVWNAAKAVAWSWPGAPLKMCSSFILWSKETTRSKKKKNADVRLCWNETVLVNYLVTYKTFKISYKTRHWQLCFVYFYWCYCVFVIIYKIVIIKLNIMKTKKPQQQHKNICIFYWIPSAIYKAKLIT